MNGACGRNLSMSFSFRMSLMVDGLQNNDERERSDGLPHALVSSIKSLDQNKYFNGEYSSVIGEFCA